MIVQIELSDDECWLLKRYIARRHLMEEAGLLGTPNIAGKLALRIHEILKEKQNARTEPPE